MYIRHATAHGIEGVYEEAARELPTDALVEVITTLSASDHPLRLTPHQRTQLVFRMTDEDWKVTEIGAVTGLGRTRIYELRKEANMVRQTLTTRTTREATEAPLTPIESGEAP